MSGEQTQEQTTQPETQVEGQQTEQVASPEAAQAEADAAFLSGFTGEEPAKPADPAPKQPEAKVTEQPASGEQQPQAEPQGQPEGSGTPEPEPAPADPVAVLTETVKALQQREAKVFGTLGALKQQIEALRPGAQSQQTAAKLTKDSFAKLSKEFPELASLLAEDLAGISVGGGNAAPVDFAPIEEKIKSGLSELSQRYEIRLLDVQHKDWRNVVKTPEWSGWVETQPDEVKKQLEESWDATFIADKVSEFKDWKSRTVQTQQQRTRRLENAVTPSRGDPTPRRVPTAEEAFLEGFNSAG